MKYNFNFSQKLLSALLFFILFQQGIFAQVVSTVPTLPLANDTVEITFNAALGDAGLAGFAGDVYAHTGVITDKSTSPTDWKYVASNWGTTDAKVKMDKVGTDLYRIKFHIRNYYGVPAVDTIKRLAFVFRDGPGNTTGRAAGGSDIFVDLALPGLNVAFQSPANLQTILPLGSNYTIRAGASRADTIRLFIDGVEVKKEASASIDYVFNAATAGTRALKVEVESGGLTTEDNSSIYVRPNAPTQMALPAGMQNGINYINDTTVTLVLYAPNKDHCFVIGDFNEWAVTDLNFMNQTPDGNRYWKTITGLNKGEEYAYQYLIDSELKVADYLSEKILDPWSDPSIPAANYPNLKPYPAAQTNDIVSVFQTARPAYQWQTNSFTPPAVTDLVMYELLVRDFSANDDYQSVIDKLDYLEDLGINAIELMPVMEFENNDSWGYNPSFMLAADKQYGTPEKLKELIDKCHARGIAVVLDIVLNHQFGQSPMVRMYWDAANNKPATNSPWFNPDAKHDFNVGYDMNHDSQATKDFTNRVVRHWIEEYRVDGYRFDLSKGFTQKNTLGNVGAWGAYDADRVALWKTIADTIWSIDPDSYVILEHFADNSEERELGNYGLMFWGNINSNYSEAAMGYHDNGKSDFNWISYKNRGWNDPNVVGYMESHDEERLMYKNLQFGARNASNTYQIKQLPTALARMELAGTFFFTVPGPKMIWQFGEVGYDVSIDENGRVGRKPVRWNYFDEPARNRVYKIWAALSKLRVEEPAFKTTDFTMDVRNNMKRIQLNHPDMNVMVLGNFDTNPFDINPQFQQVGKWYEYFTGDSITVTNTNDPINLQAGEYRLYTTKRLAKPNLTVGNDTEIALETAIVYPNPAQDLINVDIVLREASDLNIAVYDLAGKKLATLADIPVAQGLVNASWHRPAHVPAGMYLIKIRAGKSETIRKVVLQ